MELPISDSRLDEITFIRAEWFGAKGDNQTDDRPAIQQAIDYALQHHIREVKLGDGIFRIGDTLHLGYGKTFSSISLTGTGTKTRGEPGFAGTAIFADFNDRPAIAIQGARYSEVKRITLIGRNFKHIRDTFQIPQNKWSQIIINPSTWIDPSFPQSADSLYAPYAAIAIDPYSGQQPVRSDQRQVYPYPDVTYPSWTGIQEQYKKEFSSGVVIENVQIHGFVVGIVNQPCNADGNGDFTKIHKCLFERLKYAISVGNGQSRNVSIRDCEYASVYTFLTNTVHGKQSGRLDGPVENISGGVSYQFANIALNASGSLHFKNIYFEAQIKFGTLGKNARFNSPVIFDCCSFGPGTDSLNYSPNYFIETSQNVTLHFVGCTFMRYMKFMNLVNTRCRLTFESCTFRSAVPPLESNYTQAEIIAHNYLCGGIFCLSSPEIHGAINSVLLQSNDGSSSSYLFSKTIAGTRGVVHQGVERLSYTQNNYPSNFVQLRASKPIVSLQKNLSDRIINISFSGDTLKFTNKNQKNSYIYAISIGDLIYDEKSATLFVVESVNETIITAKVITNFTQIVNGVKVPNAEFQNDGDFIVFPCSVFKTDFEYRGNTTKGTNLITNVRRPDGYSGQIADNFKPGDLLFFSDEIWDQTYAFPQVTRIVSVDATAKTITVDQNATLSVNDFKVAMLS
jgi:hypothetical protein